MYSSIKLIAAMVSHVSSIEWVKECLDLVWERTMSKKQCTYNEGISPLILVLLTNCWVHGIIPNLHCITQNVHN